MPVFPFAFRRQFHIIVIDRTKIQIGISGALEKRSFKRKHGPAIKTGFRHRPSSVNPAAAFVIAVLKGGFAFLTRGFTAGVLSTCGGVLSVCVLWLGSKTKLSTGMCSVLGAVTHNVTQLLVETLLIRNRAVLGFFPALVLGGILCGTLTAFLLKILLPLIQKAVFTKNSY